MDCKPWRGFDKTISGPRRGTMEDTMRKLSSFEIVSWFLAGLLAGVLTLALITIDPQIGAVFVGGLVFGAVLGSAGRESQ